MGNASNCKGPRYARLPRIVSVLVGSLLLWSPGPGSAVELTLPPARVLDFSIVRKGEVIGNYHSEFVAQPNAELEVRTRIRAEVTAGPISLYKFAHTSVETWRNGRLVALAADTDDDGEKHHLQARGTEEALTLVVDGKTATTAGNSVPSSLWSLAMVTGDRPIFDITDGQLFKTATHCAPVAAPPSDGTVCEITGDLERTLRYGPDGVLAGVSFLADDGSKVDYRAR